MYCWGSCANGELGLGGIEEQIISQPKLSKFERSSEVIDICCGVNHTIFILQDGSVYSCGANELGQLGHEKNCTRPGKVDALSNHVIKSTSCGNSFTVAINEWGQLFSWGSNSSGQLGIGKSIDGRPYVSYPNMIKSIGTLNVIQVACGYDHALALTASGVLYAWGMNSHGQLGVLTQDAFVDRPYVVAALSYIPLRQISAGGSHSFAVTVSGSVFGWGRNHVGQLSLDDTSDKTTPTPLKILHRLKICKICCGEDHSVALTADGRIFTWGAGTYGQLGHNISENQYMPRQVVELMGSYVIQVACGRRHTLDYVPSTCSVHAFGLGGSGQIGNGSVKNIISPALVKGPWSRKQHQRFDLTNEVKDDSVIVKVVAGGAQNFVLTKDKKDGFTVSLPSVIPSGSQILCLKSSTIDTWLIFPELYQIPDDVLNNIETIFSSGACLNSSYLIENEHFICDSKNHGIDLGVVRQEFDKLSTQIRNPRFIEVSIMATISNIPADVAIQWFPSHVGIAGNEKADYLAKTATCLGPIQVQMTSLSSYLGKISSSNSEIGPCLEKLLNKFVALDFESLRLIMILPFCHLFMMPELYANTIIDSLAKILINLPKDYSVILGSWWALSGTSSFLHLIQIYKKAISYCINEPGYMPPKHVNTSNENIVACHNFYIPEVTSGFNLKDAYYEWTTGKLLHPNVCQFPFVFDAEAKVILLELDGKMQRKHAIDNSWSCLRYGAQSYYISEPYLIMTVNRHNLVESTLNQLIQQMGPKLKRPLRVEFIGEEAMDQGGVCKEFFLLLIKELLNPKYGMFIRTPQTFNLWFSENSLEDGQMFFLVGIVCGLAIYNFTIIDLPFPLVLYKKLLGRETKLDDLYGLYPDIVNSFKSMLKDETEDFENIYDLNFEITRSNFGEDISYELKLDGKNIIVNHNNKQEYVDLYVDYLLNKSVENQYNKFHEGLHSVCGGKILNLFQPEELMEMIIGSENYNWQEFEMNATYKGDFYANHHVIKWFWSVFHSLDQVGKKKFLNDIMLKVHPSKEIKSLLFTVFLTGSDRIPISGMRDVQICIQPIKVSNEYLPVAHTCFNLLDLPEYSSEENLRKKLLHAIENPEGFGLV
ncbi:putative E3 ubiquitin-protein ligase HERC4 [Nymphon striatum]|nr:putative E3 ubiquitin-protein ligase HERC4 [Nymphon striatum]